MKWAELEYFFTKINSWNLLDIWCGSWRLLEQFNTYFGDLPKSYLWIDLSAWLLDEAKKSYPKMSFLEWNMIDVISLTQGKKYKNAFVIASFHHLQTIEDRQLFLDNLYQVLDCWARVFMTNWALNSQNNNVKYKDSKIPNSENIFGWTDYNILFWDNERYYHCFSLHELETLVVKSWFTVIENRLFEGERNFITILEK